MSIHDRAPVPRKRAFTSRDEQRNALPVPHVTLGRSWRKRRSPLKSQLHVVVERDGEWFTLCSDRKATRSFPGRADQAGCQLCRAAA